VASGVVVASGVGDSTAAEGLDADALGETVPALQAVAMRAVRTTAILVDFMRILLTWG